MPFQRTLFVGIFTMLLILLTPLCPAFGVEKINERLQQANDLYAQGMYEKALSEYATIIESDSTVLYRDPDIYFKIGFIYHNDKGDSSEALEFYRRYINNGGPEICKALFNMYAVTQKESSNTTDFLIETLSNSDMLIREGAAEYLIEKGEQEFPALLEVLHHTSDTRVICLIFDILSQRIRTVEADRQEKITAVNAEIEMVDMSISSGSSWRIPVIISALFIALPAYDLSNRAEHPSWRNILGGSFLIVGILTDIAWVFEYAALGKNRVKRQELQNTLDAIPALSFDIEPRDIDFITNLSQNHLNQNIRNAATAFLHNRVRAALR